MFTFYGIPVHFFSHNSILSEWHGFVCKLVFMHRRTKCYFFFHLSFEPTLCGMYVFFTMIKKNSSQLHIQTKGSQTKSLRKYYLARTQRNHKQIKIKKTHYKNKTKLKVNFQTVLYHSS